MHNDERWPPLPYDEWKDTYATLHMWTQVVGKIALALAPPLNHGWGSALQITARGLSTRLLPHDSRTFTIEFDFVDHELVVATTDGDRHLLKLEPRSVADFYREVMRILDSMSLSVHINTKAVEVPNPIRFEVDTRNAYDPEYANRHWRILLATQRVFASCACEFVGKMSPIHFFWGSFDLAMSRFNGKFAPPREGPAFMRDAYSHEVISHGFWPGSGPLLEPAFYAYAAPVPKGIENAKIAPDAAYYHRDLGEFILPYEAVRTASDPDATLRSFVDTTYDALAMLAQWDREALER